MTIKYGCAGQLKFVMTAVALSAAVLLAGCGDKKETPATQVAAKVNGAELTVHQINFRLQRERAATPEQSELLSRRILTQLVDQELMVQKAVEMKLDQDPQILQALDAARREVLARSYVERVSQGIPKPTEEQARKYFDEHPALFAQRRVYSIQELVIQVPAERQAELTAQLDKAKSPNEFGQWLKSADLKVAGNVALTPAEQLPMGLVDKVAALPDGRGMLLGERDGVARVLFRVASRAESLTFERARPAIEAFLVNGQRRELVETNLSGMRTAAKIEYLGKFVDTAASAPALSSTRDGKLSVELPGASGAQVSLPTSTASSAEVSLPTSTTAPTEVNLKGTSSGVEVQLSGGAASAVDAGALKKGLGVK